MRYLGIDYGSKLIGLSVSDEKGEFAFPLGSILNNAARIAEIKIIVDEKKIGGIVVGDTLSDNGGRNQVTNDADKFIEELSTVQIPVTRMREAWSTFEAARFAPNNQKHDDAAAAAIILQRYLETKVH